MRKGEIRALESSTESRAPTSRPAGVRMRRRRRRRRWVVVCCCCLPVIRPAGSPWPLLLCRRKKSLLLAVTQSFSAFFSRTSSGFSHMLPAGRRSFPGREESPHRLALRLRGGSPAAHRRLRGGCGAAVERLRSGSGAVDPGLARVDPGLARGSKLIKAIQLLGCNVWCLVVSSQQVSSNVLLLHAVEEVLDLQHNEPIFNIGFIAIVDSGGLQAELQGKETTG
ncbi:hypothetical protein EYF80_042106 [Liparis tanakae]|uniref:Uncharacterized protein n=1 Tax=Liparis tanakae TaxID=230148 RepID=A0A4Z2G2A9_9TELE|nr:hypothetical protein EYF80_042106 [Liparis tanakae]